MIPPSLVDHFLTLSFSCMFLGQEQRVREMEQRVKQQSAEVENADQFQQKVMQEKVRLEVQTASLSAKLQEANKRITMLQKEKEQQSEQHEENVMKLQAKHETDISHLHREHALSAAKVYITITYHLFLNVLPTVY
ncbi:hypothetical protein GOODEAATRI_019618 [Goodea atripinnis]|uniref:Uncharacterized protein n=1 Tax=Goodea atripinnis TaxID=208336 RepID=A0ABV0N2S8_9TELE